jgi:Uncharacterized protein conserved in bacteria (DUF2334)
VTKDGSTSTTNPRRLRFCIRDDDTNFFTTPEELERAYGRITQSGPVSLAVVPFCRAGTSKAVPEKLRRTWSVHPLHENVELVDYLREKVCAGRFEIMLHGYHHDETHDRPEFAEGGDLHTRVLKGRRYLEDLLATRIRVFVPPHNAIGRPGLRAIAREGLHLAGAAGVRGGWPVLSPGTWALWWQLRRWRTSGGLGVPWILDLGDHREIAGNAVTPLATLKSSQKALDGAADVGGVFCAATHYWELDVPSRHAGDPTVGGHLLDLIERARSSPGVSWESVGDTVSGSLDPRDQQVAR